MTVQPFVDRNRSYKPRLWNVRQGLVAPEWRWAWEDLRFMAGFWAGGGPVRDLGNVNDGELQSGAIWSVERFGSVVEFAGSGEHLLFDRPIIPASSDFTLSLLVSVPAGAQIQDVVWAQHDGVDTSSRTVLYSVTDFGSAENSPRLWDSDSGQITFTQEDIRGTGPRLITITRRGDTFQFWLDDVLERIGSSNVTIKTGGTVYLGQDGANDRPYEGSISFAYASDRAISDNQILQLHRDPFGPIRRQTFRKISVATGPQTITRTLDDSFTQQETLNRDFDGNRILDDSQTLTENLTDAAIRNRNLSDSFTFADNLIRDAIFTRFLSDSNSLTENLNRNFWGDRLLSDDETLTENLTRTITQQGEATIRQISDTFTLAENLIRDQILTRLPTENFSLSEGFRNLINGDVIGAGAARRFISQFSNFIEDQTLDDNVVKDFVDGIFS